MGAIGLWLLDNPTFEDLAVACVEHNRWEFLAMIAPLKFRAWHRLAGEPAGGVLNPSHGGIYMVWLVEDSVNGRCERVGLRL